MSDFDHKAYRYNYRRTKKGLIATIYDYQKRYSKIRNHPMPLYTLKELRDWAFSQENFEELYQNWINSDYDKWTKPSIDRLEDDKPYAFENIQLMTWKENSDKARNNIKSGKLFNGQKPVEQYDLEGNFIQDYPSVSQAAREMKVQPNNISGACLGRHKTIKGCIWKFKDQ